MSSETVTALEARRLRLLIGKPMAEVDRLWRLESCRGIFPGAPVPWNEVSVPVDYAELERREKEVGLKWP